MLIFWRGLGRVRVFWRRGGWGGGRAKYSAQTSSISPISHPSSEVEEVNPLVLKNLRKVPRNFFRLCSQCTCSTGNAEFGLIFPSGCNKLRRWSFSWSRLSPMFKSSEKIDFPWQKMFDPGSHQMLMRATGATMILTRASGATIMYLPSATYHTCPNPSSAEGL